MNLETILAYLLATIVIVSVPGPNIILIVKDSISHGLKNSLMTVLGITSGMALLFGLSLAGIITLLMMFSWFFTAVKWLGVCYLFYLGISQVLASFIPGSQLDNAKNGKKNFFKKGFLISATNPKGLIFAGAFFPLFIDRDVAMIPQVAILCGGFLIIASVIGSLYALGGHLVNRLFRTPKFENLMNRISGTFLILFGIGLCFTDEDISV